MGDIKAGKSKLLKKVTIIQTLFEKNTTKVLIENLTVLISPIISWN